METLIDVVVSVCCVIHNEQSTGVHTHRWDMSLQTFFVLALIVDQHHKLGWVGEGITSMVF